MEEKTDSTTNKKKVDKNTGHRVTKADIRKIRIIFLSISIFLSIFLYKYCLFNNTVNPIVTTYFCIVSLACLLNAGLPVDKITDKINPNKS